MVANKNRTEKDKNFLAVNEKNGCRHRQDKPKAIPQEADSSREHRKVYVSLVQGIIFSDS